MTDGLGAMRYRLRRRSCQGGGAGENSRAGGRGGPSPLFLPFLFPRFQPLGHFALVQLPFFSLFFSSLLSV